MAVILPDVWPCSAVKRTQEVRERGPKVPVTAALHDETGGSDSGDVGRCPQEEIIMFDGYGGDGGGWAFVAMMFGMLVFVGLLFGAFLMLSRAERRRGVPSAAGTPGELLAGRFARGEIDEGEYTESLDVLRGRVSS